MQRQITCEECNEAAYKCSIIACIIPFSIYCLCAIAMFAVFGIIVSKNME